MIGLRLYKREDAETILSWCKDDVSFYRWSAGVLGNFPITVEKFKFVEALMPFVAFDETGIVGFFTLRNPNKSLDELRFGFVIVNPSCRRKGYGKKMIEMGIKFAFEIYGAKRVSLGVFDNNIPAYNCYKAVGFNDVVTPTIEKYNVLGEEWSCKELVLENLSSN